MPDTERPQEHQEDENVGVISDIETNDGTDSLAPASTKKDASTAWAEQLGPEGVHNKETPEQTVKDNYTVKLSELFSKLDELDKGIKAANEIKEAYAQLVQETSDIRERASASKTEIDSIKDEALVKKGTIEAEAASISKTKADLESEMTAVSKTKTDLDTSLQAMQSKAKEIEGLQGTITTNATMSDSELKSLQESLAGVKALIGVASTNLDSVTQKTANFNELAVKADAAHKELITHQAAVGGKTTEIESLYTNTQKLYTELFTDSVDKASNTTVKPSIRTEIQNLNSQAKAQVQEIQNVFKSTSSDFDKIKAEFTSDRTKFITEANDQFAALKTAIEKEIRSLLPGAGAAGLASSFFDAKSKYAATPFREDPKKASTKIERAFHYLRSLLISFSFYVLFVGPLLYVFFYLHSHFDSATPGSENTTAWNIFLRVAYVSPLVLISLFGLSSINLYRRLYEEYNHKQRVMELYHSFKEELADDENQKKELLEIMLKTVKDKPSLVMHHYEKDLLQRFSQIVKKSRKDDNANAAMVSSGAP